MNIDPNAAVLAMALNRQQIGDTRPESRAVSNAPVRPRRGITTRIWVADGLRAIARWVEPGKPRTNATQGA